MNKAILMGRLAGDPELKQTGSGLSVTSFTIAVERRTGKGEHQTDWVDCVAWRNTAEFLCKYFQKGSPIIVEGSIQTRTWEKDGQKHKVVEILADNIMFVPRDKTKSEGSVAAQNTVPINEGKSSYQEERAVYGAIQSFEQGSDDEFQQVQMDDEDLPF